MAEPGPVMRNIEDTARWAAAYRAQEHDREDALFRDPFAKNLAGNDGKEMADQLPGQQSNSWAWVTRTKLFDEFIVEQVAAGVDMVVNLGAGLDARPYRMDLPRSLRWIEVDLPDLLDFKTRILRDEQPVCKLQRVPLDLLDVDARRLLFAELDSRSQNTLILTEGLLVYLTTEEVRQLADDLAIPKGFRQWVVELSSPGLLRMIQRQVGEVLDHANASLKFAPAEGPDFFLPHGWHAADIRSVLKAAARARRISILMRLVALLPESRGKQGANPWCAICLLRRRTRKTD